MEVFFYHKDTKKKDKLDVLKEHKGIEVEPLYVLNASSFHKCVLKTILTFFLYYFDSELRIELKNSKDVRQNLFVVLHVYPSRKTLLLR
jgi:hypothetical protein